ncbi:tetratricopeptide repeat-containing sensor histidine kinase [Fulvivirga ligni]|uniref:tetratricopeptide repeat-containing sensor histidine kinase n=1 Tax=Fulvivirga ligni TaxID=2904246 RepID=UPI001F371135|nr:tetratricopeptide repeat-containing sensor histidine kinase [Fulvivirga ligni]UII21739.1 tetratricopeptide repeat-containing sensor histidine kinase [Fulvivirga ligni]
MPRSFLYTKFLLCWLLSAVGAQAQEKASKVDSLLQELSGASDSLRVQIYYSLSMTLQYSQPDSAMYYGKLCLKEAKEQGGMKNLGDAYINMGRLERDNGSYDAALDHIFASLKIYREIKDSVQIANAINDISIIYAYSGDGKKSLQYFKKALEIFSKTGGLKGEAQALNNIGLVYLQFFNDLKTAEDYFLKSLEIKNKLGDKKDLGSTYGNLGKIMEENGKFNAALEYYQTAESLFREVDDQIFLVTNLLDQANLRRKQKMPLRAKRLAEEALKVGREIESYISVRNATNLLISLSEESGNYSEAYKYLKMNVMAKDSVQKKNNMEHLQELKQKYNAENRENEIAILQMDRQIQDANLRQKDLLTYALLGGFILVLIILVLLYRSYQLNKNKKDLLAYKNARIQSQKADLIKINRGKDQLFSIISHDIKSPLNSLKGFSNLLVNNIDRLSKDDIQLMGGKINDSLNNLSELLDNLLAWSINQTKSHKLEIDKVDVNELIQKNIELYALTAASKNIQIKDYSDENIVALANSNSIHTVLRNFIGNAIKFSYPDSEIKIQAMQREDKIQISVVDEGIGLTQESIEKLYDITQTETKVGTSNEKGSGLGLILSQQLIRENQGEFYVNSEPGKGSTFTFTLPRYVA